MTVRDRTFGLRSILVGLGSALLFMMLNPAMSRSLQQVQKLWIVDGSSTSSIPAFEYNNILYASANGLADRLALDPKEESVLKRLTLTVNKARITLTAGNPYVVVTPAGAGTRRIHQMSHEVIRTDKSTFVPVAAFLPILNGLWSRVAVLNPRKPELRIEKRKEAAVSRTTMDAAIPMKTVPDPALLPTPSVSETAVEATPEDQEKRKKRTSQNRWKLDCIVLDAGHGGKDPGAIGVNGTREKTVVLSIVRKLGALLESGLAGVRVVYTRDRDTFVELDRRGRIANESGGKLFISVHCNSTEKKPSTARGFEVYLLRPGRTDEAVRIAEFENSVVKMEKDYQKRYAKLTNEQFIVINMAQSAYMKYSERFAELMHLEFKGSRRSKASAVGGQPGT